MATKSLRSTIESKHPTRIEVAGHKIHESVLRSYQILGTVKHYLKLGVAPEAILDMIDLMESSDDSEPFKVGR